MDRLQAFQSIAEQATRGELIFPTNVSASLKLQQALDDPKTHIGDAINLVTAEPLIAARTVALANSAAINRVGNEITSVRNAVMRIGYKSLHALVAGVIMRQMGSKIGDPKLRAMSQQLWEHSAHVAALAQVIARRVTHVNAETAMFAGIIHEVGGFYLLSRAEGYPGLFDGEPAEWIEHAEQPLGRAVLGRLAVPQPVSEAIEVLWQGVWTLPPESLGDTLIIANELAQVGSPLHQRGGGAPEPNAEMLELDVSGQTLAEILEESDTEIRSLTAALLV
jgi:hypothetical protein